MAQPSGTLYELRGACFVNDMTGWAVGFAGVILKTTNGGNNWFTQANQSTYPIFSVHFTDSINGCAVGSTGDILTTTNGGDSWNKQTLAGFPTLSSVYFTSALTGYIVGALKLRKTTNAGINWYDALTWTVDLNSVYFTTSNTGYITSESAYILKTTNAGFTWFEVNNDINHKFKAIHFPKNEINTGYFTGEISATPIIYKTTNAGINWIIQSVPSAGVLNSIFFTNVSTGWACGLNGTILYTSNGGTNWISQSTGTPRHLRAIYFTSPLTGWTVGEYGTILKTTNGGITQIEYLNSEVPDNFSVLNYPNPFNPSTTIEFAITKQSDVKLVIYDGLGREITILVNQQLAPGTYRAEWNANGFAAGIYFYKIATDELNETKKMVLIK